MDASGSNSLCFSCGLCCNGVIFADVRLGPGYEAERLRLLGAPVKGVRSEDGTSKLPQPCSAFDGCRCKIYADRPKHCRKFECLLLKDVIADRTTNTDALRTIRLAQWRMRKVKRLLRKLGDTDEDVALSKRFRRMKKRLETAPADPVAAGTFSELTVAMHELNMLLSEAFYR